MLSDRGGPFNDLTRTFLQALGSPNYFNHDAACGANLHNAARSIYGFGSTRRSSSTMMHQAPGALRPQHRRIADGQGGQGLYGGDGEGDAMHLHRSARQPDRVQGHPLLAGAPEQRLRAEPRHHPSRSWSRRPTTRISLPASSREWTPPRRGRRTRRPNRQEPHTGLPAGQVRSFVKEIAAQAPQVIFHPGWMTARHKQSFYVSRTALILNALMGNIEPPGGCAREAAGALRPEGPEPLDRSRAEVDEPRVDGAGTERPSGIRRSECCTRLFAAMETGQPYGIGAYFAYRHDPITGMPDSEATKRALDKLKPDRLHRRALLGDGLARRCHPSRIDLPRAGQHPVPDERPGTGLRHARPSGRPPLR